MLKNKNFANLFFGRFLSNIGDSIYYIVISWHVLQIFDDPFILGVVNFCFYAPNLVNFLFGGIIDSHSKKKLLIICEVGQLIVVIGLIINLIFLRDNVPLMMVLLVLGTIFSMNTYTIQDVMIPQIVSDEEMVSARAYMSFAYRTVDYVFNSITGMLLSILSAVSLLWVNVGTFICATFFFSKIKMNESVAKKDDVNLKEKPSVFEGFKIILGNKVLLAMLIYASVSNFFFGGYSVYKGIIANNLNSAFLFGVLNSVYALGSMLGNTIIGVYFEKKIGMSRLFLSSLFTTIVSLILCGLFSDTIFVSGFLVLFGITLGIINLLTMPIFNKLVSKEKQGIFLSAYYTISVGILPLGALFFGYFAKNLSSLLFFILFALGMVTCFILMISLEEFKEIEKA